MSSKRRSFDETGLIQLRLQRLEEQTSVKPILEKLFSTAPALPFPIAFIIGIVFAARISSPQFLWTVLSTTIVLAIICFFGFFKTNANLKLLLSLTASCLVIFALGTIRFYSVLDCPPEHISRYLTTERELATIKGRIVSSVRTDPLETGISSIPWLSSKSSFYLETQSLKTRDGWQNACGRIRVQVAEPADHLKAGDTVQIHCWLSRFSPPANPGQFDLSNYMRQRGVHIAANVGIKEGVTVLEHSNSLFLSLQNALYHYACGALFDDTLTDNDARALSQALLLGRRSGLSPKISAAFQETNLAHFISLSGMHVGIIAGSLWFVLRTCGLRRQFRAILCIVLILLYAMVVPPRAATLRAVFLSCFFFASVLIHRHPSPLNTLAISAWVLLMVRPWELFSAGWQLSFLSVLGILLLYSTVRFHLLTRLFYPIGPYLNRIGPMRDLYHAILELLAVGLSAWITISPVLLYYFGRVNPLSPLWTVLVMLPVLFILYAGFTKIILAFILPSLSAVLGWILSFAATCLETMVLLLSKVDFFQIASCRPGLWLVFGIYALMLTLALLPYRNQTARKIVFAAVIVCFSWPAVSRLVQSNHQDSLELTCLSVGHGQAAVLSGPSGQHLLFDAGSITNKDISRKVIQPFLQHKSIFSLEAIYLSHGDMDHINAVAELADSVRVNTLYANQTLLKTAESPSLENQLVMNLSQTIKPITTAPYSNDHRDFNIISIWPTKDVLNNSSISENDTSEVILIKYAGRRILLCGDIERQAQKQLMDLYPNLKADVMVLPHHGSTNNLDTRFVEHFQPSVCIASCSRRNLQNVYRPDENDNTDVFYTAQDGAVTVKIKADGTLSTDGLLKTNN
jgi:competence protein ComEC